MLKLTDLAARADFDAGPLRVSPARREIRGPVGRIHIEPIVMKVFLLLLDAGGKVVTRDELFESAWGGVFVGDDSLNRAIARVRTIAAETGPGMFEIETIPRTGYRLTGSIIDGLDEPAGVEEMAGGPVSRRRLIGASAAFLAAAGGIGGWLTVRSRSDARFDDLIQQAQTAVRKQAFDEATAQKLRRAVSIDDGSAKAWALLALVRSIQAQGGATRDTPSLIDDAERAAARALSIDARQPNALLAMFELEGSTFDWGPRDQRLRQIISIDPRNITAISELVALLQSAGLNCESWKWNERAISLEPLSPTLLGRRALKLWIAGRIPQADKVIDQARALWPSHPWLWSVKFLTLALSGRPRAAEAMLANDPAMAGPLQAVEMWRMSLLALDQRSQDTVAAARDACVKGASMGAQLGGEAVMILSALGEVDAAFDVAKGFLLSRGSIVRRGQLPFKAVLNDAGWRVNTQWLFVPPTGAMRADPRFLPLCSGVGLADYWRGRGLRPDYQLI